MIAAYPCPGDPLRMCSDSGGTWWVLVPLGLLAIVAVYRWRCR